MRTVDQLLAPISFSEFHGRHYGKKPLLVPRRSSAYYDGLLTLDALNAHLGEGTLLSTELRLIRDGEQLDESDFTYPDSSANARFAGDAADKEAVFARFYEGYTIAISSYERHRSAVLHLRHDMERVFHAPVLTYVFLTPRNAQGFGAHADAQDTFILQFAGTKDWTVFKGRKRVLSATLEPGDFLYLPRGFVHEARSADAVSGHITFVLYAYTYADLLRQIADNAHASDWLRKSLPPDFRSVARNEEFLRHVHEFFDDADLSAYLDRMHGDFAEDRLPDTTDRLADYVKLPSINADTRFRMRSVVSHELMNGGRRVVLTFNRKSLEFPAAAAKSIRFMIEAGEFGVNAVPGRTDKNLALCGTLVREGFLTIV